MAKEKIYERDYQNGIASQREKAFKAVMEKQSQYDFLHHDKIAQSTSEEKRKLLLNIKERLERLNKQAKEKIINTMGIITMAIMMAFSLSSCDKEPIIERQLITQELTLSNIYSMPMTKGFDPTTWVYEYNTEPFTLTFTNVSDPAESITRSVTIAQLQAGISISIYAGTYDITYQTSTTNTTKVDIKINMPNTVINGTPISLSALYDDYLMVFDTPIITDVLYGNKLNQSEIFHFNHHTDGFWFAYFNNRDYQYEVNIMYVWYFIDGIRTYVDLSSFTYGNVYWFTRPIGAGTIITFPEWTINKITI